MTEAQLEQDVIDWVKSQGGLAMRVEARGVRGWPDLDIRLPGGVAALVELKEPGGGIVSPHQATMISALVTLGQNVFVADSLEAVKERLTA